MYPVSFSLFGTMARILPQSPWSLPSCCIPVSVFNLPFSLSFCLHGWSRLGDQGRVETEGVFEGERNASGLGIHLNRPEMSMKRSRFSNNSRDSVTESSVVSLTCTSLVGT